MLALVTGTVEARCQEWRKTFDAGNLCASVSNPLPEPHPASADIRYQYQAYLFIWSGVKPTDSGEAVYERIRNYLNVQMPRLLCSQPDFNPNNGNILKLAVSRQSNRFIDDILLRWKPNLNQIDAVDGMTVLDYIAFRRQQAGEASTYAKTLTRYYTRFRAAGALHARELR